MGKIDLLFYACLRIRFPDVETNPSPRGPVSAVCRILCSNVRSLSRNLSDLSVASSQFDILLCSETLVSDMRHVSELLVPGYGRPACCAGTGCLVPVGWQHMCEMVLELFANQNLSVVVAQCGFLGFAV